VAFLFLWGCRAVVKINALLVPIHYLYPSRNFCFMRTNAIAVLVAGMVTLVVETSCDRSKKTTFPDVKPPVARIQPFEIVSKHGHKRTDNYYWMKNREDTAVIHYLNAENKYLDTVLAHNRALQQKLYREMKGRVKEKDESVPYKLDDYFYYTRFEEGYEYPIYCRKKKTLDAPEEIVANGNELGKGHGYFSLFPVMSTNHEIAALAMDTVGRRFYTIRFKNMATGKMLPDKIPATAGNLEWANDSKTFYYGRQDPGTLRAFQVYRHVLGHDPAKDELIYQENDSTLSCYISKTRSRKYLVFQSGRTDASFSQVLDLSDPRGKPVVVEPLRDNIEYTIDHYRGKFYVRTNLDAKNYRLVEAPENTPGKDHWKNVIPNRDSIFFESYVMFKDYLVVEEASKGLTSIRLIKWSDGSEHTINFGEPAYVAGLDNNPEAVSGVLRYSYQSMTTPPSVYDYDMDKHEKKLLKQREILGGFDPSLYQTERVMAKARDGARIPVSIVYRKDKFARDGTNPCLQYAYGSYGATTYPTFSANRLSLLDRGFVFAIAHVRGGQDMGGAWYDQGKMMNKKNTFTDFIDCSEFLINQHYAAKDKLFANGGSAGGLLMGAITNMRPDLYRAVIAAVPFVDVITTMMDESIPLTTFEWKEWGNPNVEEQYQYMLSYSPYDQVEAKEYPNLFVSTGLHDSQVQYWEPAKWVAKLRALKKDNNVIVLYTNMEAGHGGASGRFKSMELTARQYAFMLDLAGIKE
jgi:oligopeptidase B